MTAGLIVAARLLLLPLSCAALIMPSTFALSRAQTALPPGEPKPGISRELAAWRAAHYGAVRYGVKLELASLDFLDVTLRELPRERDEVTVSGILGWLPSWVGNARLRPWPWWSDSCGGPIWNRTCG